MSSYYEFRLSFLTPIPVVQFSEWFSITFLKYFIPMYIYLRYIGQRQLILSRPLFMLSLDLLKNSNFNSPTMDNKNILIFFLQSSCLSHTKVKNVLKFDFAELVIFESLARMHNIN